MVSVLNGNCSEYYTRIAGCEATKSNNRPKQITGVTQEAAVQNNTEPKCHLVHIAIACAVAEIKSETLTPQVDIYLFFHPCHVFKYRC